MKENSTHHRPPVRHFDPPAVDKDIETHPSDRDQGRLLLLTIEGLAAHTTAPCSVRYPYAYRHVSTGDQIRRTT